MGIKNEQGVFCWFSLMTSDPSKGTDFYQKMFDWKLTDFEIPGMGKSTIYNVGDQGFGSAVPLDGANIPSHWIPYVAVEDVDASLARAEKMGGKVCVPAFDMPTVGRTAVISDPSGGTFHLFTPQNADDKLNVIGNLPGQICWMELMVEDPTDLLPFYGELFGWQIAEPMPMNGGAYHSVKIQGEPAGGIMKRPPEAPKMPPVWMPYFAVQKIEDANTKAKSLGADVIMDKVEIPETGFFSLIKDPTGAMAYLFEYNM